MTKYQIVVWLGIAIAAWVQGFGLGWFAHADREEAAKKRRKLS